MNSQDIFFIPNIEFPPEMFSMYDLNLIQPSEELAMFS